MIFPWPYGLIVATAFFMVYPLILRNRTLKIIDGLERKYQQRTDELERRLSYYENAHSPPSEDQLYWKQQREEGRQQSTVQHRMSRS